MAIIIRLIVIALILYLVYRLLRYVLDPKRKFEAAVASKSYYFFDEAKNARKNFFITWHGAIFEGEKYLDDANDSVVSIFVWPDNDGSVQDFAKEDLQFLEKEILLKYPAADINWKGPIEQLLRA